MIINQNYIGGGKREKEVISPDRLKEYCKINEEVIIIIATVVVDFCAEIKKQLRELDIKNIIIFSEEIAFLERTLFSILSLEEIKSYRKAYWEWEKFYIRRSFYEDLFSDRQEKFLMIFTPPKTGTTTVSRSLPFRYPSVRTHTSSWMSPEDKISFKKHVKKIIVGVRDPIAENISFVYEMKASLTVVQSEKEWINPQDVFNYYIIDSLLNPLRREKKKYGFEEEAGYPILIQSWFEDEWEAGLNINIFDYPFDKEAGYQIIKIDECEILLYRLESMNSLEKVFREFLNIKDFKFVISNEAKSKWYNESYRYFLEHVTMPQEYIDISYNSRYMKHFYTEKEISKFREKWEKHVDLNWLESYNKRNYFLNQEI